MAGHQYYRAFALVLKNEHWSFDTERCIFGDHYNLYYLDDKLNSWYDVLAFTKTFPSKGQARKNWKGNPVVEEGYSWVRVGRHLIEVWIPKEVTND